MPLLFAAAAVEGLFARRAAPPAGFGNAESEARCTVGWVVEFQRRANDCVAFSHVYREVARHLDRVFFLGAQRVVHEDNLKSPRFSLPISGGHHLDFLFWTLR